MANPSENSFYLGEVSVSPHHNLIEAHGKSVTLQPKVMAVLDYLASNQHRVVSKEELIDALWQGRVSSGSVQKSINGLRTAFHELGVNEIVTHYAKKGYQLQLSPINKKTPPSKLIKLSAIGAAVIVCLVALITLFNSNSQKVAKLHRTQFTALTGVTNETGHERLGLPHPDNEHVLYVRDSFDRDSLRLTESQLYLRNLNSRQDWQIAKSDGSWFKFAWSPNAKELLVVEVKRDKGKPLTPNFFATADYVYHLHLFTLDIDNQTLVDTRLLTQWQGRIFSINFWDENTLDIIGKQGVASVNQHFRFDLHAQQAQVYTIDGAADNPSFHAIQNQFTARVSPTTSASIIELYNPELKQLATWQLPYQKIDVSWIPDGSGVLAFADNTKLMNLYVDGSQTEIPIAIDKDKSVLHPRYSHDGQRVFLTQRSFKSNIWQRTPDNTIKNISQNQALNSLATLSHDGNKIVYASVRNNHTHLWLIENNSEIQLTRNEIPDKVEKIIWSSEDRFIIYKAGTQLYRLGREEKVEQLLLENHSDITPIHYDAATNTLYVTVGKQKNLWQIDVDNNQRVQRTFGEIGTVFVNQSQILFQYANKDGLWHLQPEDIEPKKITDKLEKNSHILYVTDQGIYFVSGGFCRESNIQFLNLANFQTSIIELRQQGMINTHSFHPQAGSLYTHCYLAESNVVVLQ